MTLVVPAVEATNDTNRSFKPQNPNLYYDNSPIEYYYFYQQCEDHFKVVGSLDHKRVSFTAVFLKDYILN